MSPQNTRAEQSLAGLSKPLIQLASATFNLGGQIVFPRVNWRWNPGEQWAILGPNGSGKSLFVQALQGGIPVDRGAVHYGFKAEPGDWRTNDDELPPEVALVEVSPRMQRELALQASEYYQARWHSSEEQGSATVAGYLSQAAVEHILPYEMGARRSDPQVFNRARRQFVAWLGLSRILTRQLSHLSNGEQRKTLLARAMLSKPGMLILDDPYGGLDADTRTRLQTTMERLIRSGVSVLVATSRPAEIPAGTTHVMVINKCKIIAQGEKRTVLERASVRRLFTPGTKDSPAGRSPKSSRHVVRALESNAQSQPVIELHDVRVAAREKMILKGITWVVRPGERWALSGPNGAGKTTLLSLIQGDHPQVYAQNIRLFGVSATSTQSLWKMRTRMGWMSPEMNLHYPPAWPCLEVVCSGFFNSIGLYHGCSSVQRAAARQWLKQLGLSAYETRLFGELSTGVQRLVLLARAMVKRPPLVVLDEPCQGIDPENARVILKAIDQLMAQTNTTLIFITHHRGELPQCITHRIELRNGKIVAK